MVYSTCHKVLVWNNPTLFELCRLGWIMKEISHPLSTGCLLKFQMAATQDHSITGPAQNAPYRCWIWPRIQKIEQMLQLVVPGTFPPSRTTQPILPATAFCRWQKSSKWPKVQRSACTLGMLPPHSSSPAWFFNFVYAIARNPQINLHFLKNHSGKPECAKLYRYVILIDKKPS